MPATIKDIARRARGSTATVSLSMRRDPRIPAGTRDRISQAASELGYVPSNLGRALQSRRSSLAGFILADITASFYSEILQGAGEAASAAGYGLLLSVTSGSEQCVKTHLKLFMEKRVDGLIVANQVGLLAPDLFTLHEAGMSIVVCSGENFSVDIPGVVVDNHLGGKLAA